MARWGTTNYSELKKLQKKVQQLEKRKRKAFMEASAKELALRLLTKVIKRTPVGQYDKPGKVGGTLRRGWTAGKAVNDFVDSIRVEKRGEAYVIEIINPVEYTSYVEYGRRTRDHQGWVEGRFMLTISEQELSDAAPQILERKLARFIEGCLR